MLFFCQTFSQNTTKLSANSLSNCDNFLIFHTITTGHYWRNSYIKEIQCAEIKNNDEYHIEIYRAEKDEDEYELLKVFAQKFQNKKSYLGYNSNSFHLPYLREKYKAYDLPNPFQENQKHYDILKELKPITSILDISLKLDDLRLYFQLSESLPDICCVLKSLTLFSLIEVFKSEFEINSIEHLDDELLVTFTSESALEVPIHLYRPSFYLIGNDSIVKIKIKLYQNRLRVYFSNYKDYYYLPLEDMAIHKTLAASISKDTKEKATAETCYIYTNYSENMTYDQMKQYIKTLLRTLIPT